MTSFMTSKYRILRTSITKNEKLAPEKRQYTDCMVFSDHLIHFLGYLSDKNNFTQFWRHMTSFMTSKYRILQTSIIKNEKLSPEKRQYTDFMVFPDH